MSSINWNQEDKHPQLNTDSVMKLSEIPLNQSVSITVMDLRMTPQEYIIAEVVSADLDGGILWLSGKYGLQNGAYSLMNLVSHSTEVSDIVGDYQVSKIPSDKSKTGYRYEWTN